MNYNTPSIDDVMSLFDKHGIEYGVYTILADLEKVLITYKEYQHRGIKPCWVEPEIE